MKKSTLRLAAILTTCLMVPAFAFADTSDTSAQIQSLLAQIQALQQQLATVMAQAHTNTNDMMGSSTPMQHFGQKICPDFTRTLQQGSHGDDVTNLQKWLSEDSAVFPEGSVTGFFGPATARAVGRMQEKFGIASSTGVLGPRSRDFLHMRCGNEGGGMMGSTTSGWMPHEHMMGSSTTPWSGKPDGDGPRPNKDMMRMMGSTTPPMPPMHGPENH